MILPNIGSKKYYADLLRVLVLSELSIGEIHGYELARRLRDRSGGSLAVQANYLYPILYRMEDDGLIRSQWHQGANGRPQKRYQLTALGNRDADTIVADLISLTQALLQYLELV